VRSDPAVESEDLAIFGALVRDSLKDALASFKCFSSA
jgi:hypothetical protein